MDKAAAHCPCFSYPDAGQHSVSLSQNCHPESIQGSTSEPPLDRPPRQSLEHKPQNLARVVILQCRVLSCHAPFRCLQRSQLLWCLVATHGVMPKSLTPTCLARHPSRFCTQAKFPGSLFEACPVL